MKRVFYKGLASLLTRVATAALMAMVMLWPAQSVWAGGDSAERYLRWLDKHAEKMKKSIRHSKTDIKIEGTAYYIAPDGDDSNDGLSPKTPIRTIERANELPLTSGDALLFKRGGLWRGHIDSRGGVTYSAYGKGAKPQIYGSPCDAAKVGVWRETDAKNVYVYEREIGDDIGTLVFNHGQECAFKVMKVRQGDGSTLHIETKEPFADYRDLKRDLDFYHDYKGTKRVYLRSEKGNPAERFKSIELLTKGHIIRGNGNITVDNLCLKYCGSHGIGFGTVDSLTVTNCELGWIGGSIQAEDIFGRNHPTRYGNAIEIYGGCGYYRVDNCYIYQVYDAAITHQHQGDGNSPLRMEDVTYSNNLVEDCVYSIEYFLGKPRVEGITHQMANILMCNNVLRRAGEGWGLQRPDKECPAQVKSWGHYNPAINFIIRDNIFDRSTHYLLNIDADQQEWLPCLKNNVYIQHRNGKGLDMSFNGEKRLFDESFEQQLTELYQEKEATIYVVE